MNKLPENTEYEGAVGALLTVEIDGKKYAILQKRAANDSFPGCLQVTVHGGLEKSESMLGGLAREVRQEVNEMIERSPTYKSPNSEEQKEEQRHLRRIGHHTAVYIVPEAEILAVSRKTKLGKTQDDKTIRKTDVTLGYTSKGSTIGVNALRTLEKEGIIVLLDVSNLYKLVPLNPKIHKQNGVQEEGKYGMFADEIEAVKKALGVVK